MTVFVYLTVGEIVMLPVLKLVKWLIFLALFRFNVLSAAKSYCKLDCNGVKHTVCEGDYTCYTSKCYPRENHDRFRIDVLNTHNTLRNLMAIGNDTREFRMKDKFTTLSCCINSVSDTSSRVQNSKYSISE